MKESYKKFAKYSTWTAFVLFAIRCFISSSEIGLLFTNKDLVALGYNLFSYTGESLTLMAILMSLFNSFAWKWVHGIIDTPVLAKKYVGTFNSDWNNENSEFDAQLEVKQTFLDISIVFKTDESRSYSVVSTIETIGGVKRIVYLYQNEPRAELFDRSSTHKGTAELWIEEDGVLTGNYYTDRKTRGSIHFKPVRDD